MKNTKANLKTPEKSKWINSFVRGPKPVGKNFQEEILNKLSRKEKK